MTKTHELLTGIDESLRPLVLSYSRFLASNESKGIISFRVGVITLVTVNAIPGDTNLGAARNMRTIEERDALGRHDHLHDAALEEAVEAHALAQRRVNVLHLPQGLLRPTFRFVRGPGLAGDFLVHRLKGICTLG